MIFSARGIEIKTTPAELTARIICVSLALLDVALLIISLIFSFGGGAPGFFGNKVYVAKNNMFDLIGQGSAVIASKVPYADILPGNIVIYTDNYGNAALAEIYSSEYTDNVYSFKAVNELGESLQLTQSLIVGKAMSYSAFLGGLISFAKSPAGVLLMAVIPCFSVLGYEAFRFFLFKFKGISPVTPIKKQDEVPTYVPRPKVGKAVAAYKNTAAGSDDDEISPKTRDRDNDGVLFSVPQKRPTEISSNYPLYRAPQKSIPPPPPIEKKPPQRQMPLSQKRLNEVIEETKANKMFSQNTVELNQATRTSINNNTSINENLKQYTPRKPLNQARVSNTQSIPRLDELLKDDSEHDNTMYNIESILNKFDRNNTE